MGLVSTSVLLPVSAVVPLSGAAVLAGFSWLLPRRVRDLIAIAVALATTALTLTVMAASLGLTRPGGRILIISGTPFGVHGAANLLRMAHAPMKMRRRSPSAKSG